MNKQVDRGHYHFKKYCFFDRWASYWHQLDEIISLQPKSVLEIGVGDKVIKNYLQSNTDVEYKSLDIAEDLRPDFLADITSMPLADNSFDIVCAFEVLEHLPFEIFRKSLDEMKRVAKNYLIISLPHWGRHFSIAIRVPGFGKFTWQLKLNLLPILHKFNGQHYWEIGKKGYEIKKIKQEIRTSGLRIVRDYIIFESPYHHFFVLEK